MKKKHCAYKFGGETWFLISLVVNMEAIGVFGPKLGSKLSIRSQTTNTFPSFKFSSFPPTSFHGKPRKLVPLMATTNTLACEDEKNRKFTKMAPSEWGHQFIDAHVDVSVSIYTQN